MATSTHQQIKVGGLAIRFLVEGDASGESVALFEFLVPAGAKVAAAHSPLGENLKNARQGIEFGSQIPTPAHWG